MIVRKVVRTLRREGLEGLLVRLRHPRRFGGSSAVTPALQPIFQLNSVGGPLADSVKEALTRLLGASVLSGQSDVPTIHIAPTLDGPNFGPGDIALFETPAAALSFLRDGSGSVRLQRDLQSCSAVLVPSVDCVLPFREAGIGQGRLFVMSSLSLQSNGTARDLAGDLARWLIAANALDPQHVDPALFLALRDIQVSSRLCLSLPESPERRASFLDLRLKDFVIFDGIRQMPGWQGAGWSYATIARAALARNAAPVMVCEDDVQIGPEFGRHLETIETYLGETDWDLFSGLLTNFPDNCVIHHVERRGGLTFVHLNYATGMVFNIYGQRALERLQDWSPRGGQPETDTIDEWLSRMPDLRVVTTLPFLVGHNLSATSTVFGFANKRYEVMIRSSTRRLAAQVDRQFNST